MSRLASNLELYMTISWPAKRSTGRKWTMVICASRGEHRPSRKIASAETQGTLNVPFCWKPVSNPSLSMARM